MPAPTVSLWNSTDETFHIQMADELAIQVVTTRVATSSFWLGVLTTLVIALVLLSTSQQRRGPIFFIQCLAFVMAIIYNVLVYVRAIWRHNSTFRMPGDPYDPGKENRAQTTVLVLEHWIPLISDAAIIFKIIGFYPSQLYSFKSRMLRLSPPVFLLLARTALIAYLTYVSNVLYTQASSLSGQVKQVVSLDLLDMFVYIATTIFAIQAAFCLYTSCFLIYKICQFYFNLQQQDGRAVRRKSRLFIEITCMTFIPPLILSIVCAVLLFQSDSGPSKYREVVAALANISVVFSLLATSWSTIRSKNSVRSEDDHDDSKDRELSLVSRIYLDDDHHSHQHPEGTNTGGEDRSIGTRESHRGTSATTGHSTPIRLSMYRNDEAGGSSSRAGHFESSTEELAGESMPLANMSRSLSIRGGRAASTSTSTG